jgi:hypothetical protein
MSHATTHRSDAEIFADASKVSISAPRFRPVCTFMWTVEP